LPGCIQKELIIYADWLMFLEIKPYENETENVRLYLCSSAKLHSERRDMHEMG